MIISSPADFRLAAKRRLPRFLFDYADGGANAEQTLGRNVADLEGISLRQRVLQGGSVGGGRKLHTSGGPKLHTR